MLGSDINIKNNENKTALDYSRLYNYNHIERLLLLNTIYCDSSIQIKSIINKISFQYNLNISLINYCKINNDLWIKNDMINFIIDLILKKAISDDLFSFCWLYIYVNNNNNNIFNNKLESILD